MFRAFLRAKNTNAVRAKNTNAVFSATKQWRECKAKDAEKLLSQWEKVAKCNFRVKLKYMKYVSFSWNEMYLQCRKTDFDVLELFQSKHVRASMHRITGLELLRTLMLCLVQLSRWRESKAQDAEKLLSQWEKLLNAILRVTLKYMKEFLSHEMKCYLAMQNRFSCLELFLRANTNAVRAKNTCCV